MTRALTVAAVALLSVSVARAEDRPDLRVHSLPLPAPSSLHIRPDDRDSSRTRVALADTPSERTDRSATTEEQDEGNPFLLQERLRKQLRESDLIGQQRELDDKVVFRFNLGFGLDDGRPACIDPPNLGPDDVPCDPDMDARLNNGGRLSLSGYEPLRSYTFGDLVAGTRGLVFESLSAYFAAGFRFDDISPISSAIPTVHDGDGVGDIQIRSAYGEAEGDKMFRNKWLKGLSFKGGRMYEYGAGVVHFDGFSGIYEWGPLSFSLWGGQRVRLWGDLLGESNSNVSGTAITLDFYRWRKWPLVAFTNSFAFEDQTFANQGLAYQYNRDISLRANLRSVDDRAARQTLTLRARLSQVTTLFAELDNRTDEDWIYDMVVRNDVLGNAVSPQDFLNLGKPLPRTMLRLRAGTVLFEAIDVLVSGALAVEHADSENETFSPSFLEGEGAFDFRIRRAVRVGGSLGARVYRRDDVLLDEPPDDGFISRLPEDTGAFGERGFIQGGARIQYSTGARGFTSEAEFYGRVYDHQSPYFESDALENERRVGGRFTIQAFVGEKLRLRAIYDVSGSLEFAPEITGVKSLRVMMEGTF